MPILTQAIGVSILSAIIISSIWFAQTTLTTVAGIQSNLSTEEAYLPWAHTQVEAALESGVQSSPSAALTSSIFPSSGWTSGSVTAVASFEGGSASSSSGSLVCANLELNSSINERCVAVDVSMTYGYPPTTLTEREVYRVFDVSPYERYVGAYRLGSLSDRTTYAAADAGGCAGTGTGCDPNQVQHADSQTLSAGLSCVQGYNSGSCPASNVFDKSSYGNESWTNAQTGQGAQ